MSERGFHSVIGCVDCLQQNGRDRNEATYRPQNPKQAFTRIRNVYNLERLLRIAPLLAILHDSCEDNQLVLNITVRHGNAFAVADGDEDSLHLAWFAHHATHKLAVSNYHYEIQGLCNEWVPSETPCKTHKVDTCPLNCSLRVGFQCVLPERHSELHKAWIGDGPVAAEAEADLSARMHDQDFEPDQEDQNQEESENET